MLRGKIARVTARYPLRRQDGTDATAPLIADVDALESSFVDHSSRHENGGADEVSVAGLSGLLADPQTPAAHAHSAADLTSGTIPDARFPATLPAISGANLTNLDASDLASGTIPGARFPAILPAVDGSLLTNLPPGPPGAPGPVRYDFGGNAIEFVQSATPTWVAANPRQVSIDGGGGGGAMTLTVRIRALSGTVTARLRDVTNNVTAGTSAAVAASAYGTEVIACVKSAGVAIYEVQLLPSVADEDVNLGSAYMVA